MADEQTKSVREQLSSTEQSAFAMMNVQRFDHYIGVADAKGAAIVALDSAILATAALLSVDDASGLWSTVGEICLCFSVLAAAVSLGFTARAAKPRLDSTGRSLMFFGDVAGMTAEDYRAQLRTHEPLEDQIIQSHYLAGIASEKHAHVRRAIDSFYVALLAMFVAISIEFLAG